MSYMFLQIFRERHLELLPFSLLVSVPSDTGGYLLHNTPVAEVHFQSSAMFGF